MLSSSSLLTLTAAGLAALVQPVNGARNFVPRPDIKAHPLQPYKAFPEPTERTKTCFVKPSCTEGQDDAPKILAALEDCNGGGTVVLDMEYTVCSPLDLRFLKHVDIALTGTLNFCPQVDYWLNNSFKIDFQNQSTFWYIGGEDVNVYGAGQGVLNGNGQVWYDRFATNSSLQRPILFTTNGLHGGSVTGLNMRNSPNVSTVQTKSRLTS